MIVCPLCEHVQPGGVECEVCGRRLAAAVAAWPRAEALEGLEPTLRPAAEASGAGEPVPDLEPTALARGGGGALPRSEDDHLLALALEPTRVAPAEGEVEPAEGIERISDGIPGDAPTPAPAVLTCRYCRTAALPGERRCGRCGMQLPALRARAAGHDPSPGGAARRCGCGAPLGGPRCLACGSRNPEAPAG